MNFIKFWNKYVTKKLYKLGLKLPDETNVGKLGCKS